MEELGFIRHILRHGLWRDILERHLCRHERRRQMPLCWQASFPFDGNLRELASFLAKQAIDFQEGTHTIYVPPQPGLVEKLGHFVSAYPQDAGFKILKSQGGPEQAEYVGNNRSYFWAGALVVGRAMDLLPVANRLYNLGIGPLLYDLAELTAGSSTMAMFVVQHIKGVEPSESEWFQFMCKLSDLIDRREIMTTTPNWKYNDDFAPPHCNHNLIKSERSGKVYFVDTQNFLIPRYEDYIETQVRGAAKSVHFGHKRLLRGGRYLYQQVPGVAEIGKRDTRSRWMRISSLLAQNNLKVKGRIVLDIGCNTAMMLTEALNDGALWGIGWDKPQVIAHARHLLGALGYTRNHLVGRHIAMDSPLQQDIPPHLRARLPDSIVLYLAIRHHVGFVDALKVLPWKALVYEGAQEETPNELTGIIRALQAKVDCVAHYAGTASDGDCAARPLVLFRRTGLVGNPLSA